MRGFGPASGHRWMMAHLLRDVAVFLVQSHVFECFALEELILVIIIADGEIDVRASD